MIPSIVLVLVYVLAAVVSLVVLYWVIRLAATHAIIATKRSDNNRT